MHRSRHRRDDAEGSCLVAVALAARRARPRPQRGADRRRSAARDLPRRHGPRRSPASGAGPLRPRRPALAGPGTRRLPDALASPAAGAPGAPAAPEAEDPPGRARRGAAGGSATRTGRAPRTRLQFRTTRAGHAAARLLRLEPVGRACRRGRIVDRGLAARSSRARRGRPTRRSAARRRATRAALHFAVVHHTAGTNDYTRGQSAAIVRGDRGLPRAGNGWNDIGYNFLVDRYGQVFEGRYGGIDARTSSARTPRASTPARSACRADRQLHATRRPERGARRRSSKLLAWRLDVAHVDPLSTARRGSRRATRSTRPGRRSSCARSPGHRDTGFTDCPGTRALRAARRDRGARRARSACRSSTRRPRAARSAGSSASGRGSAPRCRGRSPSSTPPARSSRRGGHRLAVDWTWNSARARRGAATPGRSRAGRTCDRRRGRSAAARAAAVTASRHRLDGAVAPSTMVSIRSSARRRSTA